jgi:hypothetical protein
MAPYLVGCFPDHQVPRTVSSVASPSSVLDYEEASFKPSGP